MIPIPPAPQGPQRSAGPGAPLAGMLVCLIAGGIVFASPAAPGRSEKTTTIPLYTNEDLDGLAPVPQQETPIARIPDDWDFVLKLLDREQKLLERERQDQLEHQRLDILARQQVRQPDPQVVRFASVGFFPFFRSFSLSPSPRPEVNPSPGCSGRSGRPHARPGTGTPAAIAPPVRPGAGR